MVVNHSVEKGPLSSESAESKQQLVVSQPEKLEGLIETITLLSEVSERIREDATHDPVSGGSQSGTQGDDGSQQSARDHAITNLPTEVQMRKELTKHIEMEVKKLNKEVRQAARRATKAGNAHRLNELYARIRRLNSLLATLLEASVDVTKRLFIRIFIDKQTIL